MSTRNQRRHAMRDNAGRDVCNGLPAPQWISLRYTWGETKYRSWRSGWKLALTSRWHVGGYSLHELRLHHAPLLVLVLKVRVGELRAQRTHSFSITRAQASRDFARIHTLSKWPILSSGATLSNAIRQCSAQLTTSTCVAVLQVTPD